MTTVTDLGNGIIQSALKNRWKLIFNNKTSNNDNTPDFDMLSLQTIAITPINLLDGKVFSVLIEVDMAGKVIESIQTIKKLNSEMDISINVDDGNQTTQFSLEFSNCRLLTSEISSATRGSIIKAEPNLPHSSFDYSASDAVRTLTSFSYDSVKYKHHPK